MVIACDENTAVKRHNFTKQCVRQQGSRLPDKGKAHPLFTSLFAKDDAPLKKRFDGHVFNNRHALHRKD